MEDSKLTALKEKIKFNDVKSFLEAFWAAGERCDFIVYVEVSGMSDSQIQVPMEFVNNGFIQLDMTSSNLMGLVFDEETFTINFSSSFRGKIYSCCVPTRCVGHILDESREQVYPLDVAWFLDTKNEIPESQDEEVDMGENVLKFPKTRKQ